MTVEEWQRKTEQLKIRIPKEVMATLRERASADAMTPQAYVLRLLRADLQIV